MDQLITIDEAAEFLKNPPSVSPRPDFVKVRVLRKHIIKAPKQLDCPQSLTHGWIGLVKFGGRRNESGWGEEEDAFSDGEEEEVEEDNNGMTVAASGGAGR